MSHMAPRSNVLSRTLYCSVVVEIINWFFFQCVVDQSCFPFSNQYLVTSLLDRMSVLQKKEVTWKYIDDGTGRNSYYLSSDGEVWGKLFLMCK
jgi:hypothetical protein